MSIVETSELTDAELNEVSGGEHVGEGIFVGRAGAFTFEWNANNGFVAINAGGVVWYGHKHT